MTDRLPPACGCCTPTAGRLTRRALLRAAGGVGLLSLLPTPLSAAEGRYKALLLTCIDPRLPRMTADWMSARGLAGQYSQFSFAGAAIGVVAPAFEQWRETFWQNLAASIQLHHVPQVIVLNHRDCGASRIAYGDAAVASRDAETATHRAVMDTFRQQLAQRHPGLGTELLLMDLDGSVEQL